MEKSKIVELVTAWDAFERENPEASIEDFCRSYLSKSRQKDIEEIEKMSEMQGFSIEANLIGLLSRANRFALVYGKKLMQDFEINNIEDFVYLLGAWEMGQVKKNELIHAQISEFTSGIGVINRLLKQGLLEESPDPEDGRSKLVNITDEGQRVLFKLMPEMDEIAKMIFTKIMDEEKVLLFNILTRLDELHQSHYLEVRKKNLEEIRNIFAGYTS